MSIYIINYFFLLSTFKLPSHNVKGFLAVEKLVARADADENGTDLQTSIDHNKIIDARLAELKALSVADGLPQLDG